VTVTPKFLNDHALMCHETFTLRNVPLRFRKVLPDALFFAVHSVS
jgi:hypothetical protein